MATVLLAGTVVLSGTIISNADGDNVLSSSPTTSGSSLTGIDLNETLGLYTLTSATAPFILTDVEPITIIGPTEDVNGNPLTWSYQVTSGSLEDSTVSQSSSNFTITAGVESAEFTIQFTAQDGNGNSASLVSSFVYSSTAAAQGSFFASGATGPMIGSLNYEGAVFVYDVSDLSASPTQLNPPDNLQGGFFGKGVAFSDNKLFVVRSGGQLSEQGVFVYETSDLSSTPTFLPWPNQNNEEYPMGVFAKGNKAFVSSRYGHGNTSIQSGAIYVYDADNLTESPIKLLSTRGADRFGWNQTAIGVTSDKVIIGAYGADIPRSNQGEIHIYNLNDLTQSAIQFAPSSVEDADQFGHQVVADDTLVVVSSRNDNSGKGSVWVFPSTDISEQSGVNYEAPDGAPSDCFGQSLALHDDHLIVGAPFDDDDANQAGSVYVYDRSDLSAQPVKLTSPEPHASQRFGRSLAVAGDNLFVGSADEQSGYQSGSVYVYNLNNLSESPTKLHPGELRNNSEFSQSVAGYSS